MLELNQVRDIALLMIVLGALLVVLCYFVWQPGLTLGAVMLIVGVLIRSLLKREEPPATGGF